MNHFTWLCLGMEIHQCWANPLPLPASPPPNSKPPATQPHCWIATVEETQITSGRACTFQGGGKGHSCLSFPAFLSGQTADPDTSCCFEADLSEAWGEDAVCIPTGSSLCLKSLWAWLTGMLMRESYNGQCISQGSTQDQNRQDTGDSQAEAGAADHK